MGEEDKKIVLEAKDKLSKMYIEANDDVFSKPIMNYLWGRCKEESGFAEDVIQEHKTYDRMKSFITSNAKKLLKGKSGGVEDKVVYEWAEDYFRADDKAQIEKEQEDKRKRLEEAKSELGKAKREKEEKKKPCDEQMSIFDIVAGRSKNGQETVEEDPGAKTDARDDDNCESGFKQQVSLDS